ncbi:MAG: UDP-2,3-diacylglucosamine diphosphatase [Cytophagia bacterium]|nr:MAG: UDP-2,3-diacylglucosamine diphosphatase [Cytophagales bacterium]TAG04567.1 MAG: UDP-2,3-diacylglucosamine diphosphatase [Cytophagia bacterium]TAG43400.1 MAG: UDP-2,3-diacylglucosamine diphosphatase [Cytophagia bacterium]
MIQINLLPQKKIFFASDFHLGAPDFDTSLTREKKIIRWIEKNENEIGVLFLVGDIFDFWFEYKSAVPKGYTRLLGKIATLTDKNIPVYFFTGNHDLWMFQYFEKELGVKVLHQPTSFKINDTKFHIGHGDGLGDGDYGYKWLKILFTSRLAQWLFGWLHPNIGVGLASYLSRKSRAKNLKKGVDNRFFGNQEWILGYCEQIETKNKHDFYVFGHRHLPIDWTMKNNKSRYINLGEWFYYDSFASFDGNNLVLEAFEKKLLIHQNNQVSSN